MSFESSYKKLIKYEGGFVNDKTDKGGMTYKGIARTYNPDWAGWKIIDDLEKSKEFPKILDSVYSLQEQVERFYKKNYWERLSLDNVDELVAEEIFELAINVGISQAVKIIQKTCNVLNRNKILYNDIEVDGKYGQDTKAALHFCIKNNGAKLVHKVINIYQGAFYLQLMEQNKDYEKFIGWFSRVSWSN